MILDALEALLKLGLPVALVSWFVLGRLYARGLLPGDANQKEIEKRIKAIRKSKSGVKEPSDYLQNKWLQFGGGFYGAAALWTLLVVELLDIVKFVNNFPGWSVLMDGGLGGVLRDFIANQVQNFVAAITWFRYWADDGVAIPIWMAVAYLGYLLGTTVAKMMAGR